MTKSDKRPPAVVIYGDDSFQKSKALTAAVDKLLPPDIDRTMALSTYDTNDVEDGTSLSTGDILDELRTLPFLADRRVVVIRNADPFISASRESLERYFAKPVPHSTLVLECRSMPKNTKLHKAIHAAGGALSEYKTPKSPYQAQKAVPEIATQFGKRIDADTARQLVDLVGADLGLLTSEVEKLAMYVGDRPQITRADVADLVGQSREEKIFAVMDAAARGDVAGALSQWHHVLQTDSAAPFRAVGGIAWVLRTWIRALNLAAAGEAADSICGRRDSGVFMRPADLQNILRRLSPRAARALLANLAQLDFQAKSGTRSIDTGVEAILLQAGRKRS